MRTLFDSWIIRLVGNLSIASFIGEMSFQRFRISGWDSATLVHLYVFRCFSRCMIPLLGPCFLLVLFFHSRCFVLFLAFSCRSCTRLISQVSPIATTKMTDHVIFSLPLFSTIFPILISPCSMSKRLVHAQPMYHK